MILMYFFFPFASFKNIPIFIQHFLESLLNGSTEFLERSSDLDEK
jgi:hypothetical protein